MRGAQFKRDVWGNFCFTQKVVGVWNMLPLVMVEADTIVAFRRFFDRHMNMQEIERSGLCAGRGDSLLDINFGTKIGSQKACSSAVLFYALYVV